MRVAGHDPLGVSLTYWRDELGDPTTFFTVTALMRLARRVGETVDQVVKSHGLNRNGYLILMSLELSGTGSLILGRLAQELIVHPTTITLTVEKLEAEGLVRKTPHESDRRATRATITQAGRALSKAVTADLADHGFGLAGLSKAEATMLAEALDVARQATGDFG